MLVAVLCTRLLTYVGGSAVYETTHLCWWQCCVLLTDVGSSAVYYSPMLVAVPGMTEAMPGIMLAIPLLGSMLLDMSPPA